MTASGSRLMLAFEGETVPEWIRDRITAWEPAGFTLFRPFNVRDAEQLRRLTDELQAINPAPLPLLIAIDQEGGQLIALGDVGTPFGGNMALGAVGDPDLARRVGHAMGRELRAVGINLDYAPVCDVATRPDNPSLGIRAFGDDPNSVGRLAVAFSEGLQSAGVAATAKHFPGKGEADVDPHYELPVLDLDLARLEQVELAPFVASVEAGTKLIMIGHYAVPAVTGRRDLPATLSREVVQGILRDQMGFEGVIITDALDMGAVTGADGLPDAATAVAAGIDLLLCMYRPEAQTAIHGALADLPAPDNDRVESLRRWAADQEATGLDVLRCEEHLALADEMAARSMTLVRDDASLLPLEVEQRVLAIMPTPADLTPADTSSFETPGLTAALRRRIPSVTELVTDHAPTKTDIEAAVRLAADHDIIVVATISAGTEQGALVNALLATGVPAITVALRTPHDLTEYPTAGTYVCTYSLLEPSLNALADALVGMAPFHGRLPAAIPGLYPTGYRHQTAQGDPP